MNFKWLSILLLVSCFQIYSQQIIEYDTLTKSLKSEIPYDQPFVLKVPFDKKIEYVDYLKVKGNREWYEEVLNRASKLPDPFSKRYEKINYNIEQIEDDLDNLNKSLANDINDQKEIRLKERKLERKESKISLTINNVKSEIKKEGKISYLYIYFDWNNTFDPNSEYAILLNTNEPAGIEVYNLYHNEGKWKEKLDTIRNEQVRKYSLNWSIPSNEDVKLIYANSGLKKLYDDVSKGIDDTNSNSQKLSNPLYLKESIKCLVTDSLRKDCGLDCKSVNHLLNLDDLETEKLRQLSRGEISIATVISATKKETNLNKRVTNLDKSLATLSPILQRLKSLSIAEICDINSLLQFEEFIENLRESKELLTVSRDSQNKIYQIVYEKDFQIPINLGSSTTVLNFQTRADTRIIPDFGLIFYGLDAQNDFVGFTPYLGFRVNLRPINKDIPFSKYPDKTIFHYTSIMMGWSLTSVSEKGKREDLFGSKSFLTGIGIKLYSHSIMLNAGTLWFHKIDPNPVINTKSIAVAPYVGISVDLKLKDLVGGLGILN
jgi:hypothetical protein